jgi:hypothetical protein
MTITLSTEHLSVTLDPDRGGEFTRICSPGSDNLIAYHEWQSPLSVDAGPSYGSTELDWLSRYRAGWQVLFPNSGAESTVGGIPIAFHGETSLARLETLRTTRSSCTLRAVARLPLELVRTIRLADDAPVLHIEETVVNVGAEPVPFLWGHHPTFPAVAGSRIDLPAARYEVEPATPGPLRAQSGSWPTALGTDGGTHDLSVLPPETQVRLLYVHDLAEHWVALRPGPARGRGTTAKGIGMAWDGSTFPFMWLWLQNADPGFPWYGRARMVGLEPQRSWPFDGLDGAISRGQHLTLEPGASTSSWVTLTVFDDRGPAVSGVDRSGRVTFV